MKNKKSIKRILKTMSMTLLVVALHTQVAFAGIQDSILATGTKNLIEDATTALTWIALAATALVVGWCLLRRSAADEVDQKKWWDRMVTSAISGIGVIIASQVINAIASYYQ